MTKYIVLSICIFIQLYQLTFAAPKSDINCHPVINKNKQNYIIGYGSLLNKASRSRTNPEAKQLIPVKVTGFIRDWDSVSEYYHIIYLGAKSCDKSDDQCFLNGLAYRTENVYATDKREGIYCRQAIPVKNISSYKRNDTIDPNAEYWIYVTKPINLNQPQPSYPIMQSYVDLFLGGCIEQAADIANKSTDQLQYPDDYQYVFDCIQGTNGWTTDFWLNDRVYPERPWAMEPNAFTIDKILAKSYADGLISGKYDYWDIPLA